MRSLVPLPLAAAALAVALVGPLAPAYAQPAEPGPVLGREAPANGPERNERAAGPLPAPRPGSALERVLDQTRDQTSGKAAGKSSSQRLSAAAAAPSSRTAAQSSADPAGYPRQTNLPTYPANPDDRSLKLDAVAYYEIAPMLNALQDRSDRVSAEVIGQTQLGRDLYLVTVTAPETAEESARQAELRRLIEEDPALAAVDPELAEDYKAPVFVNANIHGNEWEGTDAALEVITELATSDDAETAALLEDTRLYFLVSMNPDGRVAGTRRNASDFDMNRDWITQSQPEVRLVRDELIEAQPLVMLDLHGYVNGTLVEPTTPPHGQNYEYDLFIKHAYANALGIEQAILDLGYTEEEDGVSPPQIPFRDWDEGWDDWPPIFTPQYAAFHGAVSHTIEIPLRVNNRSYDELPAEELRRRSAINTAVAAASIRASIEYTVENREELVADQIEIFRRGAAGEALHPVEPGDVDGLIGPEDIYTTTFPRAYVIPVGRGQRSAPAAARLVDHLVTNDVRVTRATEPFRLGGRSYPVGSYVVDMHQPKRGLANVMLEPGADISDRVDSMYDISGWSLAQLWGASVDTLEDGALRVSGEPVAVAAPTGSVTGEGALSIPIQDPQDFAAINALLAADVAVRVTWNGSVVVPAESNALARTIAERYGVVLTPARSTEGVPVDEIQVAAAAASDELWALREMGFSVRPVSTDVLNEGFDWDGVDVLLVSSGLDYEDLTDDARADLTEYISDGGVVTRGRTGAAFNEDADLLDVNAVEGRRDANGVVNVDNAFGPITSGSLPHSFVYSPLWFTELGRGVAVEQRYDTGDVLVSGHWRATAEGTGGQSDAAGHASVVRGWDESGASVVMFGTEPMFRAHPKGLYAQVGRALHWTAATAEVGVPRP